MIYGCGCVNKVNAAFGVLHCLKKCAFHVNWSENHPQGNSAEYFTAMGLLENGIPNNRRLMYELVEALDEMQDYSLIARRDRPWILELGCGLGSYIPFFLGNGWQYRAIEKAEFAAQWTRNTFCVEVIMLPFEEFKAQWPLAAIFAAHFFEHVTDAPAMLTRAYNLLGDEGKLYLILPDDEDPTNPDHYWFFTEETLRGLLYQIGFKNIKTCVFRRTKIENFIYCVAEK